MKNRLEDLRNHLFATLEGLTDPDPEKPMDIERAKAVTAVAGKMIDSAKVEVDFLRVVTEAPPGMIKGSGFMATALEHKSKD